MFDNVSLPLEYDYIPSPAEGPHHYGNPPADPITAENSASGLGDSQENEELSKYRHIYKATQTQLLVSRFRPLFTWATACTFIIADLASFAELVWASPDLNDVTCLLCACIHCVIEIMNNDRPPASSFSRK